MWKEKSDGEKVDVVVSNPPYISSRGFDTETARSVRNYEPKLALVPPQKGYESVSEGSGDTFYPVVAGIAEKLDAKVLMVEVGGCEQAGRVKAQWQERNAWKGVGIWKDYAGKGRGVVAWKEGWEWAEEGPVTGDGEC